MIGNKNKLFTLQELIVTLFILGLLTGIAIPSFNKVIYNSKYQTTLSEARALAREAMATAKIQNRFLITSTDFGSNDMDRYTAGLQQATGNSPWYYTSQHNMQALIDENGIVTEISSGGTNLGITSSDGAATITTLGNFTDTYNGTTIDRTDNKVKLTFNSANWQYIITTYSSTSDQLFKTSGSSTVGVMVKNSNTDVDINLAKNVNYTVLIKYNGSSSGSTYTFQAIS